MEDRKISLSWNLRAFIPVDVQALQNCVVETFVPSEVAQWSDADIQAYWSVPEKLMDLGWLFWREQNPGMVDDGTTDVAQIRNLQTLEFYLYDFVRRLLIDIRTGKRELNKLGRLESIEKQASRWRETSRDVLRWYDRAKAENRDDEILRDQRIPGMARELAELDLTGLHWRRLKQLVGIARGMLRQTPLDDSRQRERIIGMWLSLCRGVLNVFESDRWEKILREPGEQIKRLRNHYWKILKRTDPEKARKQGEKEKLLDNKSLEQWLWIVMEQAVQACIEMLSFEVDKHYSYVALVKKVKKNMERFIKEEKLSKGKEKRLQKYYQDGGRCVAMIRWRNSGKVHKYVAFSGYLECSDPRILEVKGLPGMGEMEKTAWNAFNQICKALKSHLVAYEKNLKSYVWRYALDSSVDYLPVTTLEKELGKKGSDEEEKEKRKALRFYSCCERKILGYLEENKLQPDADVTVIVKFDPCVQCYTALRLWKKELETKGIGLFLNCPSTIGK